MNSRWTSRSTPPATSTTPREPATAHTATVPQHGTLLRVSKDGLRTDILATGFRAPNGVCLNPDGTFFMTDQEGHWIPKNRINHVKVGGFYGNMWGYHDVTDPSDAAMEPPVCWITNAVDRSPSEIVRVEGKAWGPLEGQLLSLSYGYGKVFVVPHETVAGRMQGGVAALPIPPFPTGIMRGRFHPADGSLYACGLFGWASNQEQPGRPLPRAGRRASQCMCRSDSTPGGTGWRSPSPTRSTRRRRPTRRGSR